MSIEYRFDFIIGSERKMTSEEKEKWRVDLDMARKEYNDAKNEYYSDPFWNPNNALFMPSIQ